MSHKKRYFVATRVLVEGTEKRNLALLRRASNPDEAFETEDFEVASEWAKKIRERYPEQGAIILEQIDP